MDLSGSGFGPVAISCEDGNGSVASKKGEKFCEWHRNN
jgi:hypothetical protein